MKEVLNILASSPFVLVALEIILSNEQSMIFCNSYRTWLKLTHCKIEKCFCDVGNLEITEIISFLYSQFMNLINYNVH